MRLKITLGIVGLGAACSLVAALISSRLSGTATNSSVDRGFNSAATAEEIQPVPQSGSGQASASTKGNSSEGVPPILAPTVPASNSDADKEKHEAYVEARTAQLRDLARKSDATSVVALLSEIKNPDREIREAALDALIQSGNRSVIPALEQTLVQTESAEQKKAIRDAIEFLKLPTLTETLRAGDPASRR